MFCAVFLCSLGFAFAGATRKTRCHELPDDYSRNTIRHACGATGIGAVVTFHSWRLVSASIWSPLVWRVERNQQCAIYFAFLVWDSVRARHTSAAETAARPRQGRRSRNVMTMVALS